MEANCIVLSISPYTGCYKHVRVPLTATFFDLHMEIQSLFEFDNDHLFSFFLSGRAWDEDSEIKGEPFGDCEAVDEVIGDYAFAKGASFLYLFDYGDEWRFTCKVLRYEEAKDPSFALLRSKGENPQQYDVEEEDWGDEDWEDEDEEDWEDEDEEDDDEE